MTTAVAKRPQRAIRTWDPFQSLRDEVESLWSNVIGDRASQWLSPTAIPPLDVMETSSAVEVKVDLPGFKTDDIHVQINKNVLVISGRRVDESEKETETCHRMERRVGEFSRSVSLPAPVDEEKVDAQYRDGVLTIVMQKTPDAKSHQIKVKG